MRWLLAVDFPPGGIIVARHTAGMPPSSACFSKNPLAKGPAALRLAGYSFAGTGMRRIPSENIFCQNSSKVFSDNLLGRTAGLTCSSQQKFAAERKIGIGSFHHGYLK